MIHISAMLKAADLRDFIHLAPKLRCVITQITFDEATCLDLVEQTGGCVIIEGFGPKPLFSIDNISSKARQNYVSTKAIIARVVDLMEDPDIVNEWAHLEE